MSPSIELRYHQAVIALAEELNFNRAADRLHITQSALTKQIRALETELGYSLFQRDKKHVSLLHQGEVFVAESRLAVMHSERAVHLSKGAAETESKTVTVGRSPYTDPDLVSRLFNVELPMFPKLEIQLDSAFAPDLVRSVANGALDMAIVTSVPETRGITQVRLQTTRLHVALPEGHPAARRKQVHLRDLAGTRWAMFAKHVHPWLYDSVGKIVEQEGIPVAGVQHIMSAPEGLALVVDQQYVAFITEASARQPGRDTIVFRALEDEALLLRTALILRGDSARLVDNFARTYVRQFERKAPQRESAWHGDVKRAS